jgi:LacI family transcriptional regulator
LAVRGISDAANAANYDVILANTSENLGAEEHAVRVFLDKRVDAVIAAPSTAYSVQHLKDITSSGRPLVLLDRHVPGVEAVSVGVSISPAAREASMALIELGHRRIAYISSLMTDGENFSGFPLGISSVEDRLKGILAAYSEAGITPDPELIRFKVSTMSRTTAVIGELLKLPDPPTAFLASDSSIARHILLAFQERGIQVPSDVSLIALDDFPWAPLTLPPLTVMSQPIYEAGFAAGQAALDAIEGRTSQIAKLEAHMVYRGSHGPVPSS